ncbi:hypothetical protein L226DRAFT_569572 [Lentinus tigrinus ALCF2SS1-7]|uniref:Uncharacterized protein n=1 Tax=Lentinus tigrinus ALCF2SS1-6 TaxID=1328759 RepID=A0A5C2SLQ7_9APHY|nr:hypothetical protein L227DRAFT_571654 [Lentinus tigrinus ALCF2SS1-6]RPD76287.1 hypothetical protein L226DRAFT_569572 [Lentinus tigrinus ALCF2SS1-7]
MATMCKCVEARAYQKLFSSSSQIIVAADTLRYWKSPISREKTVLPALKKLQELKVLSDD